MIPRRASWLVAVAVLAAARPTRAGDIGIPAEAILLALGALALLGAIFVFGAGCAVYFSLSGAVVTARARRTGWTAALLCALAAALHLMFASNSQGHLALGLADVALSVSLGWMITRRQARAECASDGEPRPGASSAPRLP